MYLTKQGHERTLAKILIDPAACKGSQGIEGLTPRRDTSSWSESESEWGGASQSTPSSRSSSHSREDSDDQDALQRHLQRHLQQQTSAENSERKREWQQDTDLDESESDSDDSADRLPQVDPSVHGGFISILQCCKSAFPASPPGSSFRLLRPCRYAGNLFEKAHVSQGQAVLLIETLADEFCLAKTTKSKIYKLFKQLLPDPNTLPKNAYYASKLLKAFMPKIYKFPVCIGDCILLPENTKPNRDVVCPNCQQKLVKNGKARKYFRTLPLKSIVRHMFASWQIAQMLGKEWIYNVTPGWLQSFTSRDIHATICLLPSKPCGFATLQSQAVCHFLLQMGAGFKRCSRTLPWHPFFRSHAICCLQYALMAGTRTILGRTP